MTKYLSTFSAAIHRDYSESTLRNSRLTGTLVRVTAPTYKKMGKSIRYDVDTLNTWLAQFSELENTKQNKEA